MSLTPVRLSPAALEQAIHDLRVRKNAVILAHYYQDAAIQDIADFVGDSLDLSRKAANTDADVIAFCGVRFMAEVAKILSPSKTVVLPDLAAGCSLEIACPPDKFSRFRDQHPDHIVVTYINCSAAIKALSNVIVTSSNAEKIINQIPKEQPIIFAPDKNLGAYLIKKTGRDMLLWDGACIVHERFSARELVKLKTRYPAAPVIAHPECEPSVLEYADFIGSTSRLLEFVRTSPHQAYIVATEPHIVHQMQKSAPSKQFYMAPDNKGECHCHDCPYMAMNTMEKLYHCLDTLEPQIVMDEGLRLRALRPLQKMLEMS
jgi:quinolinate synthase